jgi:hypothetical protein
MQTPQNRIVLFPHDMAQRPEMTEAVLNILGKLDEFEVEQQIKIMTIILSHKLSDMSKERAQEYTSAVLRVAEQLKLLRKAQGNPS